MRTLLAENLPILVLVVCASARVVFVWLVHKRKNLPYTVKILLHKAFLLKLNMPFKVVIGNTYPWRRYLARMFDVIFGLLTITYLVLACTLIKVPFAQNDYVSWVTNTTVMLVTACIIPAIIEYRRLISLRNYSD